MSRSTREYCAGAQIADNPAIEVYKMAAANASKSGSFKIGGDIEIHRLGFGAMRITGRGIWGPPADKAEVLRTLQRLPQLGVNFIDTADSLRP